MQQSLTLWNFNNICQHVSAIEPIEYNAMQETVPHCGYLLWLQSLPPHFSWHTHWYVSHASLQIPRTNAQ